MSFKTIYIYLINYGKEEEEEVWCVRVEQEEASCLQKKREKREKQLIRSAAFVFARESRSRRTYNKIKKKQLNLIR